MTLRLSPEFSLPLELAGEAIAILAKRGAGKTNTATVLAEELVGAGVQTVILDPVGAWWGIRSGADGESPGLEVPIIGGGHGDVPLEPTAGALIADVVVESGQSLLVDLSDLPTKAAVGRFVTDFAQRLYRAKARDHAPVHLILEEADSFAPQKVRGSEQMQSAIEQVVRRGRSRGLGVTLITQRSAVLSKDVLTQADVLIVMRTTGPHDLRAIREWIDSRGDEHGRDVLDSLPSLATGEAWIWNPERDLLDRVQVRARRTFDSSRTPRAGEKRAEPRNAAPIDLAALGSQIAATAERVKADDPKALRKRISDLERELAKRPTEEVVREIEKLVEVPTPVFNGEPEALERILEAMTAAATVYRDGVESIFEAARQINMAVADMKGAPVAIAPTPRASAPARREPVRRSRTATPPAPRASEPAGAVGDFAPTPPQQKVLDAIAWLEGIGLEGDRQRVAFLSGYRQSGNFNNLISSLNSAGAISYPRPGSVALTDLGASVAMAPSVAPTSEDIQALVLAKLTGPQQKVLHVLLDAYPEGVHRQDLADATGYQQSGNFNNIVSKLSSLGVATYPSPGYVAADPLLFIE